MTTIKPLYVVEDGKVRLNLHRGQKRAWKSKARFVFVVAGTQGGKCLDPDSLILMANGERKRVPDVKPGDAVLSLDKDERIVTNKVVDVFSTGEKETVEVITESGRKIIVTPEHPLYSEYGWFPAGELKPGCKIGIPRLYPHLWSKEDDLALLKNNPHTRKPSAYIYWDSIREITSAGKREVWDITVESGHSFIANGILAHNTSFGPWWLWNEINTVGAGDYLAVTSTYDLFKLKMLPELRKVFEEIFGWHYAAGERTLISPGEKARIILRSAQTDGGLESATAKAAWLDECGQNIFGIESWEAVQRRLSLSQGRVLGTTTPYNLGWLYGVYKRFKAGDPDYDVIQFRSIDNAAFPLAEYERARNTLPAWKFEMFYNGQFEKPAGLIYSDFNDAQNVCEPFEIPQEWPRYVGVDFGGVHMASIWVAEDLNTGKLYIYRETLEGDRTVAEHARQWLRYSEPVFLWTGGAPSEEQYRRDFTFHGVPIRPPMVTEVENGILRTIEGFKTGRLVVMKSCPGLLGEIAEYSREVDVDGNPTEKIENKSRYHLLDCLRYLSSWMFGEVEMDMERVVYSPVNVAPYLGGF